MRIHDRPQWLGQTSTASAVPPYPLLDALEPRLLLTAAPGEWTQWAKLTAADGTSGDSFGGSVSISGDVAVVGAMRDDDKGSDSGSAYILRDTGAGWEEVAKLTAGDGAAGDWFGNSVSISGDTAIVGATADDDKGKDSGSAYIFRDTGVGWQQVAKLTAPYGGSHHWFGQCVSISGGTALVSGAGSVYIFRDTGTDWEYVGRLEGSTDDLFDSFGYRCSISEDAVIVGAHDDDDKGENSGSAYVFRDTGAGWDQVAKLTASDGAAGDWFGISASISGDMAVVGANYDDDDGESSGSAYVFRDTGAGWQQVAKLTAGTGAGGGEFGRAVSISGGTVIVGGWSGPAYIFRDTGAEWERVRKLTAGKPGSWTSFGGSVSISGDVAIVGARNDDNDAGVSAGSAYVFHAPGAEWAELLKLTAGDAARKDGFGHSVSISGDTAVVGAHEDEAGGPGSAYIFRQKGSAWQQAAKLTAGDGAPWDGFGYAASISGDTAVIGACQDDDKGEDSGSAYIFRRKGSAWQQVAKLTAGDGAAWDNFGLSVSISGNLAIVGAHGADSSGDDAGSAYVFRDTGGGWEQVARLTAGDGAADDHFGGSVSISGGTAIVGASWDDDQGTDSGSAYIFRDGGAGWGQVVKLTPDDGAEGDWFGTSVSISGDTAIVGAHQDDDQGEDSGSAYIFRDVGAGWQQVAKLTAHDGTEGDMLGVSVSISGDRAIAGAPMGGDRGEGSGSAYVYRETGGAWQEAARLTAGDGGEWDWFGASVSISGDTTIAGAPWDDASDDDKTDDSGSAYVFHARGPLVIGEGEAGSVRFVDADGTTVTASLRGGGTAEVLFDGYVTRRIEGKTITVEGTDLAISQIFLSGTTARSTLSFSTKGGSAAGTSVGGIRADGTMGSISGKTVDLTGDITIAGLLKKLQLDDVAGGRAIEINADRLLAGPRDKVTLVFDRVADTRIDTHTLPIGSLTVTEWVDTDGARDVVLAPCIGKLTAKGAKRNAGKGITASNGNFQPDLALGTEDVPAGKTTLGSVQIRGNIGEAWNPRLVEWYVVGPVGSIRIDGEIPDWTLAVDFGPPGSSLLGTVKSLTLGDVGEAHVHAADAIGSVKAVRWAAGYLQADSIKSLNVTGRKGNVKKGVPDIPGDFNAGLSVRGQSVTKGSALGSARIAGNLTSVGWEINGDMGKLTVGRWVASTEVLVSGDMLGLTLGGSDHGRFRAGIDLDTWVFGQAGQIRSVAIKGWKLAKGDPPLDDLGVGSSFWAARMGSVSLMNESETDATQLRVLGETDAWQVKSVTCRDTRTKGKWTWRPGQAWPGPAGTEPQPLP